MSLLAVVLLAKKFSLVVDVVTVKIGAPPAFAGLVVAALILLPESVAAVAAARKNDLQKSINLALGSSIATIGLTVPAVALAAPRRRLRCPSRANRPLQAPEGSDRNRRARV